MKLADWMKREVIITADGYSSVSVSGLNVSCHSINGAIQESQHVFIEVGLHHLLNTSTSKHLHVFEMGFGTGLNCFLTAIEALNKNVSVHYTAVEVFPLTKEEWKQLNYTNSLDHDELFSAIHMASWNRDVVIHQNFTLNKIDTNLINFSTPQLFNLIFYDAFAPAAQPELWTKEMFDKLYSMMTEDAVLVTYCSKGDVRRAMMAAGFRVEKLPGPSGKREMLRAVKAY